MKTTSFLASLLFGSFAAAAPVDKRALVLATHMVTETVVVFTTVFDDGSVPSATTTPAGYFYEQPQSSPVAQPTSSSLVPVVPVQQSSSTPAAKPAPAAPSSSQAPAPAPAPAASSAPAQQAKPSSVYVAPVAQAAPTSSSAAAVAAAPSSAAPVAATSAAAAAPAATSAASSSSSSSSGSSSSSSSSGDTYQNVDITIYDNNGSSGACGTALYDTDMIVAIAKDAWGKSTYDKMTGAATNPWCGQKIKIDYNGNSVDATIMDLCPGCSGFDLDLSLAAWTKLTGKAEKTRLKASWSKIS